MQYGESETAASAPREHRGALFADVCDSTRLYEELGDDAARTVVVEALDVVRAAATPRGGRVVDRIGDELFLLFPTCGDLIAAAIEIQQGVARAVDVGDLPPQVAVRVGCHYGPVVLEGDSVFGHTVYTAKRVASIAKAKQIVTTLETTAELADDDVVTRPLERVHLKGQARETELCEILYGPDATIGLDLGDILEGSHGATLHVEFQGAGERVSPERPRLTLGRDELCDLKVDSPQASRLHARIEWDRGRFRFVDLSTNGTRIEPDGGDPIVLRRDWCLLEGRGRLVLGPETGEHRPQLEYRVEAAAPE